MSPSWDWPGSRWWRCDLHIHTPASFDFANQAAGSAKTWLQAVVDAGLEVVAVTDHNTGAFVDETKQALSSVADPPVIFPAVELTVQPGVHLLIVFDPSKDTAAVTAFLGACKIPDGKIGGKDAVAPITPTEAMRIAVERGAICIAAHADDSKGLLKETPPNQSLQSIITSPDLHGVEMNVGDQGLLAYVDNTKPEYRRNIGLLAILKSSDAHALDQIGRRFTWIKMTRPDLGGLRLALQDGPLSVMPGDSISEDPNAHASHTLESIEIQDMKYIGRGSPLQVKLNPWLNAIIGGRGTGKSSILECIRIAFRREDELPEKLRTEFFDALKQVPGTRDAPGLLTHATRLAVVYRKEGTRFRIRWDQAGTLEPIEEAQVSANWTKVTGDVKSRFPIRIYSQKQIFEMAEAPQALLQIVDDSVEVGRAEWNQRWREEESRFLALRAKARELKASLEEEGRIKGELDDVKRKLAVFEKAGHAAILREYQLKSRQQKNAEAWQEGFSGIGEELRGVARGVPSTVALELFDPQSKIDSSVLDLARVTLNRLAEVREKILALATEADSIFQNWVNGLSKCDWQGSQRNAENQYSSLIQTLKGAQAGDPSEYGRLVQERQRLEQKLATIRSTRETLTGIERQASDSLGRLLTLRQQLSQRRMSFLKTFVGPNPHVRVEVLTYGDRDGAESQFRELIGRERPTFQSDIWSEDGRSGVLADLYRGYPDSISQAEFEKRLDERKKALANVSHGAVSRALHLQDQRFSRYLSGLKPEVFDRLDCWFPDDSLRVSYSPRADGRDFRPIEQGSPGQKTAAILAFLLSYGQEPMVLDQPEDDLDNHLIYDLIVKQLRERKQSRQIIVVTHNANIVVNGDAELVLALDVRGGQTRIVTQGGLQEQAVRDEICRIMEGGREAFERRYQRIGLGATDV